VSLNNWDFALNNRELYYLMFSLKKPSDEYSLKGMDVIKEIFVKLTDKNENELDIAGISLSRQEKVHNYKHDNINSSQISILRSWCGN